MSTDGFRNLEPRRVELGDGCNLILGGNGQGKTNLLEALAVAGNLRSFRSAGFRRVARHGESRFTVTAWVEREGASCRLHQEVEVGPPLHRRLSLDGGAVDMAGYLGFCPVFTISPADSELVSGGPETRRAFIDRLVFLLEPRHLHDIRRYRLLLRHRNAALVRGATGDELGSWETQLAASAAAITRSRRQVVQRWAPQLARVYDELRPQEFPTLSVSYRGDPWDDGTLSDLEQTYHQRYNDQRARDRRAGFTLEGPHRHDLVLRANGRPVRDVLSSGQTRVVAAALRLAVMVEVERARGEFLPLIIDDVDAELDAHSVSALLNWIGDRRQVFLSSAHEDMWDLRLAKALRYRMQNGSCSRQAGPGDRQ